MDEGALATHQTELELALRLLKPLGEPPFAQGGTRLLAGELPDHLPVPRPVPQHGRLLGSMRKETPPQVVVVVDVNVPPEHALVEYRSVLVASGWQVEGPADRLLGPPRHWGFEVYPAPTPVPGIASRPLKVLGCSWPHAGHSLRVIAVAMADGTTDMRLALRLVLPDENDHTAVSLPAAGQESEVVQIVPPLPPPLKSHCRFSVGGGGRESQHSTAELITTLGIAEVVAHYSQLLQRAGWYRLEERTSDSAWRITWRVPRSDSPDLQGVLCVLRKPWDEEEYYIEARVSKE